MAVSEVNYFESGSGSLSATLTAFNAASVSISCNVGDIVVLAFARSSTSAAIYWNGTAATSSSDYGGSYADIATNCYTYFMTASQASNTFSCSTGTLKGGYTVITNS